MCNCRSNYLGTDGDPEAVLVPPASLNILTCFGEPKTKVAVDFCIVGLILKLWDADIKTLSSCCGHNLEPPTIILADKEDAYTAYRIAKQVGKEDVRFLCWIGGSLITLEDK